ncbi:nitrate reductase [Litorilituus lipolyticus]|nr:nitrate reductase [Litorilituus lipolyticus]
MSELIIPANINQALKHNNVKTTCPYCGVGCGVTISTNEESKVVVQGDKQHPANLGNLCIKGKNLAETIDNSNRLVSPRVKGQTQTWSRALDYVASKFNETIAQHGKESVAFYVSGQLLTEDYYVANKLMKGFIGSGNIDTNSRLCMSSAVSAHKRAFGEDIVPTNYDDLIHADVVVLAGSNLAWCHPILFRRLREEKARRPELKVIVIDPRVTACVELADLHLQIKAGCDLILFNSLLNYLAQQGCIDVEKLAQSTSGLQQALDSAQADSEKLNGIGLSEQDIEQFFSLFAQHDKVVTVFSQGINQSRQGSDQGNAIINCHLASDKIGKLGSGPFSMTGQPNAMGGREVGALANTLAGHIEFEDDALCEGLAQFWQTDNLATKAGLKAIDLFDAIDQGKIKAVWIMATNPLVSLPDHDKIKGALQKCPLVVVSDCVASNDTLEYADVIFPAQTWGEKSGTVTNSERRISRQRPFLTPFGEAKADWWIISEVAKRMGFSKAFNFKSPKEIFAEHAGVSGLANLHRKSACNIEQAQNLKLSAQALLKGFDISAYQNLSEQQYQQWLPVQWPQAKQSSITLSDQRFFTEKRYFHSDAKARFIAVQTSDYGEDNATSHVLLDTNKNKEVSTKTFTLNTGRNRDQWHTQTRSGKSGTLTNRHAEPELAINPNDALKLNIEGGDLVKVENERGQLLVRAHITEQQRAHEVFIPIHWSSSNFTQGCVSQLVAPLVDKVSGQPAFKHSQVTLTAKKVNSEAMLVVKKQVTKVFAQYQVKQKIAGGYCYHIASELNTESLYKSLCDYVEEHELEQENNSSLNASEPLKQYYRKSYLHDAKMYCAVLVGRKKQDLPHGWLSQFYQQASELSAKRNVISADIERVQAKKTFCQCLNIAKEDINQAVESGKLTLADIRNKTGAGNGCGSCIGDIALMLNNQAQQVLE